MSPTTPKILGRIPIGVTAGHERQPPTEVEAIGFGTRNGVAATVLTYGGHLTDLLVPDRRGRRVNVVLRLPDLAAYEDRERNPYFGALIGRYANRIADARFTLDDIEHRLEPNEGPHLLHGGPIGLDRYVWETTTEEDDEGVDVLLRMTSPDGDQGFPGELDVQARYRLDRQDRLTISFQATTSAPTVVNLTNHAYWNLAGRGSVLAHVLQVNASRLVEVDDDFVPTGALVGVRGGRFDFRGGRRVPQIIDHCLLLDAAQPQAVLIDPASGRRLQLSTDLPGLQVYSGFKLDRANTGVALEAQHLPDAPNHPNFPSVVLRPGETYRSRTVITLDVL